MKFLNFALCAIFMASVASGFSLEKLKKAGQAALSTGGGEVTETGKQISENKQNFLAEVKKMNDKCGSKIQATYDVKTEPANVYQRPAGFGYQFCGEVIKALGDRCEDADAKPVIVEKITSVSCTYKAGSSKKMSQEFNKYGPEYDLVGTTLNIVFDDQTANIGLETYQWVMNKL